MYHLEAHTGSKYKNTFALVNRELGVSHWEDPDCERYTCVLHAANYASQLSGCVSVGMILSLDRGLPVLGESGVAMRRVLDNIGIADQHEFLIEDRPGGWET
jgi:hypothetical protein